MPIVRRLLAIAVVVAASAASAQQSVSPELRAALDRCWARPIVPGLIRIRDLTGGVAQHIVMTCWDDLQAVARAIDPQACTTDTPACAELEEKIEAEAGADIYGRVKRERERLHIEFKIRPKRKGEPTYE